MRASAPPLRRSWSWRCRQLPADYHAIAFATAFLALNPIPEPGGFAGLTRYRDFFVQGLLALSPRSRLLMSPLATGRRRNIAWRGPDSRYRRSVGPLPDLRYCSIRCWPMSANGVKAIAAQFDHFRCSPKTGHGFKRLDMTLSVTTGLMHRRNFVSLFHHLVSAHGATGRART